MFEEYNKIKKCIRQEMPFITDGFLDHMSRKICDEISIKYINFPKSDHMNNLRYVIGDAMEELYGKYTSTDEDRFGVTVGVGKGVISKIIQDGAIAEEDFIKVCSYLNPSEELKTLWKNFYLQWV